MAVIVLHCVRLLLGVRANPPTPTPIFPEPSHKPFRNFTSMSRGRFTAHKIAPGGSRGAERESGETRSYRIAHA